VVRVAVAKFESTTVTPIFARTAVAPAKRAESSGQTSQLFTYAARFYFNAGFFFGGLDYGGSVLFSETQRNGRLEIFFGNANRGNGRPQIFTKFDD
jgi:hypothetical protein